MYVLLQHFVLCYVIYIYYIYLLLYCKNSMNHFIFVFLYYYYVSLYLYLCLCVNIISNSNTYVPPFYHFVFHNLDQYQTNPVNPNLPPKLPRNPAENPTIARLQTMYTTVVDRFNNLNVPLSSSKRNKMDIYGIPYKPVDLSTGWLLVAIVM